MDEYELSRRLDLPMRYDMVRDVQGSEYPFSSATQSDLELATVKNALVRSQKLFKRRTKMQAFIPVVV